MKLFKIGAVTTAIVTLVGFIPASIGSSAIRVGHYDFTYLTTGDHRATPIQIFDDGKNTFFQFRAGDAIPAVFVNRGGEVTHLVPEFKGPYVTVSEVGGRFTLQLGRSQAQVVYAGSGREGSPMISAVSSNGMSTSFSGGVPPADPSTKLIATLAPAQSPQNALSLEANSYATPVKGDKVSWNEPEIRTAEHQILFLAGSTNLSASDLRQLKGIADSAKNATRINIIGRDDSSHKEGLEAARGKLLRDALVKFGVSSDRVFVKIGAENEVRKGLWSSDIEIQTVIPTLIAKHSEPRQQVPVETEGASARQAYINANLDQLVRSGVLTREQAMAMKRKHDERAFQAPAQQASVEQQPRQIEAPVDGFNLKASDLTVTGALRRWAAATNYQIVWDAPAASDAPITGDATLRVDNMKSALEKVVAGLKSKGYDLTATMYSNRVIRFTGNAK